MPKVTLVDYGLGNIQAFYNIYKQLNIKVNIASTPSHLEKSEKIILPGVGSFDWAMSKLNKSGLREVLDEMVITKKIPILGVCVGMQMMSSQSEEGDLPGLGWIDASVVKFSNKNFPGAPLPHMGWNDVYPKFHDGIFNGITEPCFYFLHSYYIMPNNTTNSIATSRYGINFTAAIEKENIFGTQFHPEKSHEWGIQLLKNFSLM